MKVPEVEECTVYNEFLELKLKMYHPPVSRKIWLA